VLGAEVLCRLTTGVGHGQVEAPRGRVEMGAGQYVGKLGGLQVGVLLVRDPQGGDVDDDGTLRPLAADDRLDRLEYAGQVAVTRVADDQQDVLVGPVVVGEAQQVVALRDEAQVLQVAGAVVAAGVDLEERPVEPRVGRSHPALQERSALRLRGVEKSVQVGVALRPVQVCREVVESLLRAPVGLCDERLEDGLLEVVEAHVACQLGHRRVPSL
jgi:hypothetical protein